MLAEKFGVGTDHIKSESGHSSPSKVVAITRLDDEAIRLASQPAVNDRRRRAYLFHMGQYEKSLDDISEVIRREPANAEYEGKRSLVLEKLYGADEAAQDRKKVEELST